MSVFKIKSWLMSVCTLSLLSCGILEEKTPVTIGEESCNQEASTNVLYTFVGRSNRIYFHTDQDKCGGKSTYCRERHLDEVTVQGNGSELLSIQEMVTVNEDKVYLTYQALQVGEATISFNVVTTNGTETISLDVKVIDASSFDTLGQCEEISAMTQNLSVSANSSSLTYYFISDIYDAIIANNETTEYSNILLHIPEIVSSNESVAKISTSRSNFINNTCIAEQSISFGTTGETELSVEGELFARVSVGDQYDGFRIRKETDDLYDLESICLSKTLNDQPLCYDEPFTIQVQNDNEESCELITLSLNTEELEVVSNLESDTGCFEINSLNGQACQFTITESDRSFSITVDD